MKVYVCMYVCFSCKSLVLVSDEVASVHFTFDAQSFLTNVVKIFDGYLSFCDWCRRYYLKIWTLPCVISSLSLTSKRWAAGQLRWIFRYYWVSKSKSFPQTISCFALVNHDNWSLFSTSSYRYYRIPSGVSTFLLYKSTTRPFEVWRPIILFSNNLYIAMTSLDTVRC